jgi:hypothetical protein
MSIIYRSPVYLLGALVVFVATAACHTYYKATPASSSTGVETAKSIDSLQNSNRYFILRNGNTAYTITNPRISDDRNTLHCRLEPLPQPHQLHLLKGIKGKMQYNKKTAEGLGVLTEVHFYVPYDSAATEGNYSLTLNRVQKIEVIEHDKKKTTNSYVIGALGYTLGAAALVAIIIAATKSSCPFVSAYDGNEFSLQGEIYGGSIYPQLARHDYLPLKMLPKHDGTLQLKISNELHERQYTDIADLWVITHAKDVKVLSDEHGNVYSIANPRSPSSALLNNSKNVLPGLKTAGDYQLLYMDDSSRADASNEVVMKFDRPAATAKGKLLLTLKNSYWLDLLYGEVAKGFGTYYAGYMAEQRTKSAAELLKWVKEQQIPLEISVKTTQGWKKLADITTIGPLATREIVVPVELPETDEVYSEIKLSAGFMFWEIDYAAMDFSDDNAITIQKLPPIVATDEKGMNILRQLQNEDAVYLEQPEIGNTATLVYNAAVNTDPSKVQTCLLHAKGYYEHIRDFKNKPDVKFLSQFRQPGALPVYGMQLYQKIRNESLQSLAGHR